MELVINDEHWSFTVFTGETEEIYIYPSSDVTPDERTIRCGDNIVIDENGMEIDDYYLSNAAPEVPLEEFARVGKAEHRIEECIQRSKSEAGLDQYEVRNWTGWYHHQTLSLIATWFLVTEARRGKRMDTSDHRSTNPRRYRVDSPPRLRMRYHLPDRPRARTTLETKRTGSLVPLETT